MSLTPPPPRPSTNNLQTTFCFTPLFVYSLNPPLPTDTPSCWRGGPWRSQVPVGVFVFSLVALPPVLCPEACASDTQVSPSPLPRTDTHTYATPRRHGTDLRLPLTLPILAEPLREGEDDRVLLRCVPNCCRHRRSTSLGTHPCVRTTGRLKTQAKERSFATNGSSRTSHGYRVLLHLPLGQDTQSVKCGHHYVHIRE